MADENFHELSSKFNWIESKYLNYKKKNYDSPASLRPHLPSTPRSLTQVTQRSRVDLPREVVSAASIVDEGVGDEDGSANDVMSPEPNNIFSKL